MNGGELKEDSNYEGAVGRNMFDLPSSKDNQVSVVIPLEYVNKIPIQSLIRIKSIQDSRIYQGIVIAGPFYEPDNLRADSPLIVNSNVRGGIFMPPFHGRALVEITGEEVDGKIVVARFRPIPNNPVFVLGLEETRAAMKVDGDIALGTSMGQEEIEINLCSDKKGVLPRHVGILGTTGGGKSTTVSGLIKGFQQSNLATVLIDTEGEYTCMNGETTDEIMKAELARRGKHPEGVKNTVLYHLIGKQTANPKHPIKKQFCLKFESISPYAMMEILELSDAQQDCFRRAYDIAYDVLKKLSIYPCNDAEETELMELDEFDRGLPNLTLQIMYDIVQACSAKRDKCLKKGDGSPNIYFKSNQLQAGKEEFVKVIDTLEFKENKFSWYKVKGKLGMLLRYGIFDNPQAKPFDYNALTKPGAVSIIDLSDTDSPQINNLVIAEMLRGLMLQQDTNYKASLGKGEEQMNKTMVIIEEAHEFLSTNRIKEMPELYQQVARIAKRGRKRWLGLVFVTQLPQHLPDEVLGLINNFILHKIADGGVINRLKKSIGNVDETLWNKLPSLAPGQAIASFGGWSRPLLVSINPTACRLLMVE